MSISRATFLFASMALGLSATGCDPGFAYQPVGPQSERLTLWSETVEGVRFSAKPYSTLIGCSNTVVYLDIANETDKEVVVLGGQLVTNGRTIEAHVLDDPANLEARTVPPGESRSVMLYWAFGGSASDVLGPAITWAWHVRIGPAEYTLRVPMQRQ